VNDETPSIISSFELQNCFPNPFNPTTTIRYHLSKTGSVNLKIYDLTGREVATLVNEKKPAGIYSISWNATRLSSGVYFSVLTSGKFSQVKKMLLIK
jgi:Tol biopolymer transport system component